MFHVGGARTALRNWALARHLGGTFVLRIEDTDEARNRPEWTQGIIDALAWIGISADDPTFEGPYFQSDQRGRPRRRRRAALRGGSGLLLRHDGRGDPGPRQGDGHARLRRVVARPRPRARPRAGAAVPHPRRGRDGRRTTPCVARSRFANDTIEDFVLLRGNGSPIFVLANVVDDIEMGITHVVRGEEHLPNTPEAAAAVGGPRPRSRRSWAHVPVLVNEQRKKLSKRRDKVALESYRDEGYLADAMVNYLMTLGWAPKGDSEIVPWSRHRGRVPARGRHALAGVLRRQEAGRRSTATTSGPCRSTSSSPPASRGSPTTTTARSSPASPPSCRAALADAGRGAASQVDFLFTDDPLDRRGVVDKAMTQPWPAKLLDAVIEAYETAPWEPGALERAVAGDRRGRSTSSPSSPRARCACR